MAAIGRINLSARFGLTQQPYATQDTFKMYLSSQLGWDITKVQEIFPRYHDYLDGLGWSSAQILQLTYPTCCHNEAYFECMPLGDPGPSRGEIKHPPGKFWFNSELLWPQGTVQGSGSSWNYGQGGTQWCMDASTFKSIFDLGETERHGFVSSNLYTTDWHHNGKLIDMHVTGDAGDWNDDSYMSNGAFAQRPGETFDVQNVYFERWNDYGLAFFLGGAPSRTHNCSFFHNGKGGVGILDGAIGVISVENPSGDQNPAMVVCAHWDHTANTVNSVGGEIDIRAPKIEGFAPTFGTASTGSEGKGQILFWFEGPSGGANTYFHMTVLGGQAWTHGGYQYSLIRLNNYNNGGLDHYITVRNLRPMRHRNMVQDVPEPQIWVFPGWHTISGGAGDGQQAGADYTENLPDWTWNSIDDSVVNRLGTSLTAVSATAVTGTRFHGPQDQDPNTGYLPTAGQWDPDDDDAIDGVDPVSGTPYGP